MKIKMKLLSDAIPGSGEGAAGLVDTDIVHDEFGLPIIPAKRIKGILRESSRDLEDAGIFTKNRTEALFGKRGNHIGADFKISDGYVENYPELRKFLAFCSADDELSGIFNREAVLKFYTYARSQTTIENGVAKNDTLRTFRVLRKDLVFCFDAEYRPEWEQDMETICKVTRRFGISRTRGTGEILLTIHKSKQTVNTKHSDSHEEIEDDALCRLNLNIHNIGQLLVTNRVGKNQISENCIPGTFILGSMAYSFIKHRNLNPSQAHFDQHFRNIFLDEQVIFSNAYPSGKSDNQSFDPSPVSIVKEKDKENYFDMADFDFNTIIDQKIQTTGDIGEFVQINQGEVTTHSVLSEMAYHHWRPEDRTIGHATEKAGKFFQFTVLKPDQRFIAHITGKYRYLKLLNEMINERKFFYFGKSKTAQYGKCEIQDVTIEKLDGSYPCEWQSDELAVFTLESDMILRDENGLTAPDPEILKNEIEKILNADNQIAIEKSFLKFKQIGGFSGVWNMPRVQTSALAGGSVIVCKNTGDTIADISCLEIHAFGIRTEEGFGRIKVNWHGQDPIALADHEQKDKHSAPDDLKSSGELIRHILYCRLEDSLKNLAVENCHTRESVSNSFIGRIMLLIKNSENFEALHKNLSELKERAVRQLDKIARNLFLKETKRDNQPVFITDNQKFIQKIAELRDSARIESLRRIVLPAAKIQERFYEQEIFKLYQVYSAHFLTLLRLRNRKAVKNGKR